MSNSDESALFRLFNPGELDRFENLLAAALGVVGEAGQREHPMVEVGEADLLGIDVRVRFDEGDGDVLSIGPLHCAPPRKTGTYPDSSPATGETWSVPDFGLISSRRLRVRS